MMTSRRPTVGFPLHPLWGACWLSFDLSEKTLHCPPPVFTENRKSSCRFGQEENQGFNTLCPARSRRLGAMAVAHKRQWVQKGTYPLQVLRGLIPGQGSWVHTWSTSSQGTSPFLSTVGAPFWENLLAPNLIPDSWIAGVCAILHKTTRGIFPNTKTISRDDHCQQVMRVFPWGPIQVKPDKRNTHLLTFNYAHMCIRVHTCVCSSRAHVVT